MGMRPISRDRADLAEWRAASAAAGGTALSTTLARVLFPKGTQHARLRAHTFVTATVAQVGIVPFLSVLRTNDNLATDAVDESERAQDADAATHVTLDSFPALANGGFLLIGAVRPFRGVHVTMDANVNANASVLTVKYRKTDDTWAAVAGQSDGTILTGATFGQTGAVTWTVPTDWKRASLLDIADLKAKALTEIPSQHIHEPFFWTRWEVSAALDASTLVDAMVAMARSTAYAELRTDQDLEMFLRWGIGGNAGLEAQTDAGTAKLIVNVAAGSGGFD